MFKGLLQSKDEKELSQLKFLLKEMFSDGRSSTAREIFNKAINKVFHQNNIWNIQPYLIFKKETTNEN